MVASCSGCWLLCLRLYCYSGCDELLLLFLVVDEGWQEGNRRGGVVVLMGGMERKRLVSGIRRLASEVWSLGLPLVLTMETQEGR